MPTAFVAGATGYTGHEVVRALSARGITTFAHVRPDSGRLSEWRERLGSYGATVDTTPWTTDAMTATLRQIAATHVFALLGTTRARAKRAQEEGAPLSDYEAIDYGLTHLLLGATRGAATSARFIYLSAAGVSSNSTSPYYEVRARVEREVAASGLPFAIARPSFITGDDRSETRTGERIGASVADAVLSAMSVLGAKRLQARYRSTDAQTLARGLLRVALDESVSRVFESQELR